MENFLEKRILKTLTERFAGFFNELDLLNDKILIKRRKV